MSRTVAISFIVLYTLAAIAIPVGSAVHLQQTGPASFMNHCSCGCNGDPQKCMCRQNSNTVTFTPCGTATNNILLPDANLSIVLPVGPDSAVGPPAQHIPLFSPDDGRTLSGVATDIEHPPRV